MTRVRTCGGMSRYTRHDVRSLALGAPAFDVVQDIWQLLKE